MGIGNRRRERGIDPPLSHLITPHGDREHGVYGGRNVACVRLITPHGDRELASGITKLSVFPSSLPLMGIGNTVAGSSPCPSRPAHYPSWGSGTRAERAVGVELHHLITPHGDREPSGSGATSTSQATHYPSWGSGTRYPAGAVLREHTLITPHGDREPRCPPRSPGRRGAHYPSWGSGTWGHRVIINDHMPLITPHGDRERAPFSERSWVCISSHYPSWGSGTGRVRRVVGNLIRSLPLMGIGNTRAAPACASSSPPLITPHGDRERVVCQRACVTSSSSLPLMGIGNGSRPWRRSRAPLPSHYPSWGSGTRMSSC